MGRDWGSGFLSPVPRTHVAPVAPAPDRLKGAAPSSTPGVEGPRWWEHPPPARELPVPILSPWEHCANPGEAGGSPSSTCRDGADELSWSRHKPGVGHTGSPQTGSHIPSSSLPQGKPAILPPSPSWSWMGSLGPGTINTHPHPNWLATGEGPGQGGHGDPQGEHLPRLWGGSEGAEAASEFGKQSPTPGLGLLTCKR